MVNAKNFQKWVLIQTVNVLPSSKYFIKILFHNLVGASNTFVSLNVTRNFKKMRKSLIIKLWDHTISLKFQITRSRLRERLQLIDIQGKKERRRVHRRMYNVSAPNHLWHIDTNHKLIRWHFVIAGGVDGLSRFVVFLRCIDNNKSQTKFQCFKSGVDKYGIPLRVRSGQGLENYDVAKFMIETRCNLGMITGKSTHNKRIERLWCFVFLLRFILLHGRRGYSRSIQWDPHNSSPCCVNAKN